uniref:Uncharacterized protein n=1 Tax=uncultured marine group II/III euryarchaeote KM3_62_B06 TaxID=1456472 RepID=A0A075HHN5_9EURY|nr:hypothetical protein [uncultured marine group II/III euryarchaeote KM3_62_B06]
MPSLRRVVTSQLGSPTTPSSSLTTTVPYFSPTISERGKSSLTSAGSRLVAISRSVSGRPIIESLTQPPTIQASPAERSLARTCVSASLRYSNARSMVRRRTICHDCFGR